MKNAIRSINSRTDQAKERICEVEDRTFVIVQSEKNENKKSEESLS